MAEAQQRTAYPHEVLQAVCEDMDHGLVVIDRSWVYRYANPTAARILGVAVEDLLGRDYRAVFPQAEGTVFQLAYERVMATGVAEIIDEQATHFGMYMRNRILPVSDGIAIFFYDSTEERRRAVGQLRELELLNQLVSHTTNAIVVKDLDGRFVFANDRAMMDSGLTPAQVVGLSMSDVMPPEMVARVRQEDLEVQRTRRPTQREDTWTLADGRELTHIHTRFPVYDRSGALAGTGSVLTDITDRKKAEAELVASEERYRGVFAAASLAQLVLDRVADRVVEANPAFLRLIGYELSELRRVPSQDLLADPVVWIEAHQTAESEGRPSYEVEAELVRADGSTVPVLATVNNLGDGTLMSCIVRDLSQLRLLQRRLIDAERLEAVGAMAGGIAHDVNNVLAAVSGYASLLEQEPDLGPACRRHVTGIHRSVERASDFVSRLLAFAREQVLEPADFDLAVTVTDLADMCRRLLDDRTVLVADDLAAATVRADQAQVQQVLLNLVLNARDALTDGGTIAVAVDVVELGVDEQPGLDRGVLDEGLYARARVTDDGVGMSEEVARRCFEPFFTTRRGRGGHGFGLSTAIGIARQSGGDLRVSSEEGAGSTFALLLPLQRQFAETAAGTAEPTGPARAPTAPRRHGRLTTLVADDDEGVLDMVREVLRASGHDVVVARDGAEALRLARALGASLDLLVTDVQMPGRDGLSLVREVRAEKPDLRVVVMSGRAPSPPLESTTFLRKPFGPGELRALVAETSTP